MSSVSLTHAALQQIAVRRSMLTPKQKAECDAALEFLGIKRKAVVGTVDPKFDTPEAAAKAKESLRYFVEAAWRLVEPEVEFAPNWHIDRICETLERVTKGELKRVLINVPPGCMKSLLVSVFWPAWEWARNPRLRYLAASYSSAGVSPSTRDNLRLRDVLESSWYKKHFWNEALAKELGIRAVRLKGDQNEKLFFQTTAQGWRFATSIGGPGTGSHPDRIIIDDPLTAEDAASEQKRDRVWRWFKRTISSRGVARDVAIILIMQRLHVADLAGKLLAGETEWCKVVFPMYFVPEKADPLDPRKKRGDLLWPLLFTREKVKALEIDLDEYGAAGQLQQDPVVEGGGLFKAQWFVIIDPDEVPDGGVECRGWDIAGTEGGGAWTVGTKIRKIGPTYYVMHQVRGQWEADDVDRIMAQTAMMDGASCRQREEQEPGSSGKDVISDRAKMLVGFDYDGTPAKSDKVTRARPYRAQCAHGNVKLVAGPWNQRFVDEHTSFPVGVFKDQVDSAAIAFNELALGRAPMKVRPIAWG